jgi:AcrR family transcriptional regulator
MDFLMTPDTKSRILDAALALFNEQGTSNVTTNHIAEALGMSPGNLYYHYRNKAEIVRGLFARIMGEWAANYAVPPATMPSIPMMETMVAGNFDIQARYRFFFRDLTLLLNADPELATAYRANRAAGIGNTKFLIGLFSEAGVLMPLANDEALDDLAQLLWLVGDFWLVFKDTGGAAFSPTDTEQGVRLFRRLLTPHLHGDVK